MDFLQCPRRAVAGKKGERAVLPMNLCKGRKTQGSRELKEAVSYTIFHREKRQEILNLPLSPQGLLLSEHKLLASRSDFRT